MVSGYVGACPNIIGTDSPYGIESEYGEYSVYNGAFYLSDDTGATNAANHIPQDIHSNREIKFDASRITKIYGASSTVQPRALQTLIIIKV